jgi:predicted nucleotidyltransferase
MINERPTEFRDLNEVLRELTARAAAALGANFFGAYLVGSFAVGGADEFSDVDFIIPTKQAITRAQETRLRSIHAEFPERESVWAQHLEGSYPPFWELRTLEAVGRAWLYIDNGAKEMERSTHCNTAVVRWSLRESGVVLTGPHPRTFVEPVSGDELRDEAVDMAATYRAWLDESGWEVLDDAWTQPYVVVTFCRILNTVETGRVTSKRLALLWALDNLDGGWRGLIQSAIDDRPDPWERVGRPARTGSVEPTRRFVEYALSLVR